VIADDTLFFRVALKDILTGGGYDVVAEAENGAEAVTKAGELRPDIVILDVVMPVKNGLEAARDISLLNLPLKIVMCSSLGYEPIVEDAIRSGANAYIMKPLDKDKVLETLETLDKG
jgi:two-component system chemotaxis response regulator CheY